MKYLITLAALVLFAASAQAVTVEQLQAQIDSIRAAENDSAATATQADVDSIVTNRAKLVAAGITIIKDTEDGNGIWVQIDFPVTSATGWEKAALKMTYLWLKDAYGAQDTDVVWRCRIHRAKAKRALLALNDYF